MKIVFLIPVLLILFCLQANAQAILPVDENNKITFTDVVETDSLKKEQLYENIKRWLTNSDYKIQINESDSSISKIVATNYFKVFAKGYLSKKYMAQLAIRYPLKLKTISTATTSVILFFIIIKKAGIIL